MHKKYYKGYQVEVIRTFRFGGVLHCEVVKTNSGEESFIVEASFLGDRKQTPIENASESTSDTPIVENIKEAEEGLSNQEKSKQIVVTSAVDEKVNEVFEYKGVDYFEFLKSQSLDQDAVEKCLKGKQKTHKNFKFSLE